MTAAILSTDLKYYRSTNDLGGAITATEIPDAVFNALFDDVPSAKALSGEEYYAFFFIKNTSAYKATACKVFVLADTPSPTTHVELAVGTAGVNTAEQSISDQFTAPTGLTFSTALGEANALSLPDLNANDYVGVCVKYVVDPATTDSPLDNFKIRVAVDSPSV